jgi:hypothetical protein
MVTQCGYFVLEGDMLCISTDWSYRSFFGTVIKEVWFLGEPYPYY